MKKNIRTGYAGYACIRTLYGTLYREALARAQKPCRIGLLFTQKNCDFGMSSVTEQIKLRRADLESVASHIGSVSHFGAV